MYSVNLSSVASQAALLGQRLGSGASAVASANYSDIISGAFKSGCSFVSQHRVGLGIAALALVVLQVAYDVLKPRPEAKAFYNKAEKNSKVDRVVPSAMPFGIVNESTCDLGFLGATGGERLGTVDFTKRVVNFDPGKRVKDMDPRILRQLLMFKLNVR